MIMIKIPASWLSLVFCATAAGTVLAQQSLPQPEPAFAGKIARTVKESMPAFPDNPKPPQGAPNVLVILTDDVGFGASSTFGGPVATTTMDELAQRGLRYNRFHVTAACSPTRASLLTGRQPHAVGYGAIENLSAGFPGYNSVIPKSAGTVAEVLKQHGYNTAMFGKNHNTPKWETSAAGPFDRWPTGLGFEYFYGFMGGETDQWQPALYENTVPVTTLHRPDNYHLDQELADNAIAYLHAQQAAAPNKPFFVYYATGTPHAPLHAPADWIAKYKGKFDQGWDKVREQTYAQQMERGIIPADALLTPRPEQIPAWDSLSADEHRLYARYMEVYAATLAHADYQIGRVIHEIQAMGELDNTLIIYIQGDNGGSAEGGLQGRINQMDLQSPPGKGETLEYALSMIDKIGGPWTHPSYPVGWAHAMDTPFQWTKLVASHLGGIRTGMIISWPDRIGEQAWGSTRSQFHFVADIAPTILSAVGVDMPKELNGIAQQPLDGVGMNYTFTSPDTPSRRTTQYFENQATRSIYHDGWMASTTPVKMPWKLFFPDAFEVKPDSYPWELYHLDEDFSQARDLAKQMPAKLKEMRALFDAEAVKYNVYPLDHRGIERVYGANRPSLIAGRTEFTYYPDMQQIASVTKPHLGSRSFSMTAYMEIPRGGAEGILATEGNRFGGWVLMVKDGKPEFVYAASNREEHHFRITAGRKLSPGRHEVRFDFESRGGLAKGGVGTLSVDGEQVGDGSIGWTLGAFALGSTLNIGQAVDLPVVDDYLDKMPFGFTGKLEKLVIEVPGTTAP